MSAGGTTSVAWDDGSGTAAAGYSVACGDDSIAGEATASV